MNTRTKMRKAMKGRVTIATRSNDGKAVWFGVPRMSTYQMRLDQIRQNLGRMRTHLQPEQSSRQPKFHILKVWHRRRTTRCQRVLLPSAPRSHRYSLASDHQHQLKLHSPPVRYRNFLPSTSSTPLERVHR